MISLLLRDNKYLIKTYYHFVIIIVKGLINYLLLFQENLNIHQTCLLGIHNFKRA